MDYNYQFDKIDPSIRGTMTDAEQYRLRRMIELMEEAKECIQRTDADAMSCINDSIATASSYMTSIEEGMRASVNSSLAIAMNHSDRIGEQAAELVNSYLSTAIDSIVSAGEMPTLSPTERIYYDNYSPAEAYTLSKLEKGDTLTSPPRGEIIDTTVPPVSPPPIIISPPITLPPVSSPPIVISPPPTVAVNPLPVPPPIPGKVTKYLWVDDPSGQCRSIAVNFDVNGEIPDGYHDTPCPPESPPTTPVSCIDSLPTSNINGGTNQFSYLDVGGTKYMAYPYVNGFNYSPDTIKYTITVDGKPCVLALSAWPPPPPPVVSPPSTGVDSYCGNSVLPPITKNGSFKLLWKQVRQSDGSYRWMREYFADQDINTMLSVGWARTGPAVIPDNVINGALADASCTNSDFTVWCMGENATNNPGSPPTSPPPVDTTCPPGCIKVGSSSNDPTYNTPCGIWDNPDKVCEADKTANTGSNVPPAPEQNTGSTMLEYVFQLGGMTSGLLNNAFTIWPSIFSSIFSSFPDNPIIQALQSVLSAGQQSAVTNVDAITKACGYSGSAIFKDLLTIGSATWAERLSGCPVTYFATPIKYNMQFQLPVNLPSQGDFDGMYLSDMLTYEQWRCYTRGLGNLPFTHQIAMESKRSRPDARAVVFLNRYKKVDDTYYAKLMRQEGFINEGDRKRFEQSLVNLPGLNDITRFMVRDVEDDDVVKDYELDSDFEKKYKDEGKLKLWADAQGIPVEAAKYYWRAHWEYPSNTALYEMIRRLRPGRRKDGLEVTYDDALKLLGVNDMAPGWRKKLLAISYLPITRTDVKRGYNIDAIEEKDLVALLQDDGYTEEDSKTLVEIMKSEKQLYKQSINLRFSAFTPKQIANMVANGEMNEASARDLLIDLGLKADQADKALSTSKAKAGAISRKRCIKSIRYKYMNGMINLLNAQDELTKLGVDNEQNNTLIKMWGCEFILKDKEVPASKNIEWYIRGIIDIGTLANRLTNLGYDADNASNWVSEAVQKQQEKVQKEQEKVIKELQKQAREAERTAKQRQKEQQQRVKDATKG